MATTYYSRDRRWQIQKFRLAIENSSFGYINAAKHSWSGLKERTDSFDELAIREPSGSNMARHAAVLVSDGLQNPYRSFQHQQKISRSRFWNHHLFAGATQVRRFKALPMAVGYILAVPRAAQSLLTAPARVIANNGKGPDFDKGPAIAGYRYLERYPLGIHKDEVVR